MDYDDFITLICGKYNLSKPSKVFKKMSDEVYLSVAPEEFRKYCLAFHKELPSPVMMMFAGEEGASFKVYCSFLGLELRKWFFVVIEVAKNSPKFTSIAKEMYSANLFEREIKEMFGIEPQDSPDGRRLRLHDEVWPQGSFPLRKDFAISKEIKATGEYRFSKVEGSGIFEVPVGPVHAGIIGPGHFRFSVAGEPIINLEIRLGFTHRGIEKLIENKKAEDLVKISECVAGDSSIAHSLAFCKAVEKISGIHVPDRAKALRVLLLELERMYNHVADIGGIALDVGFSQPSALASILKEELHSLNEKITGSRFLKGMNVVGGVQKDINENMQELIISTLKNILNDFNDLKEMLLTSVSFIDRVDTTGILRKKTAEDFGVMGVSGRASGVAVDLRKNFMEEYQAIAFKVSTLDGGDVLARLNVRFEEFAESFNIIKQILLNLPAGEIRSHNYRAKEGFGLGIAEGARGPVLYWVNQNGDGKINRCKIVDPSFRSWPGLSYAVFDNIIPDFPVCNKSFNLSYPGNDL